MNVKDIPVTQVIEAQSARIRDLVSENVRLKRVLNNLYELCLTKAPEFSEYSKAYPVALAMKEARLALKEVG